MRKKKLLRGVVTFCLLLILVLVILYSGLQILESTVLFPGLDSAVAAPGKTITRDGVDYYPRQDITVMLVMGIDNEGPVESSNYYRNSGQADSIMLFVFDETNEECTVLYINRDTMLDMDVLGVKGEFAGTIYGQVALAHTYGTGLEDSSVNVKNTLMKFIHGMTIDYYVAINMDAITILNDAVGGVTVNVVDDFSDVDPSITMGELTLKGEQALNYIRTRKDIGDQKNVTRMARHEDYVNGFMKALQAKEQEDANFILDVYADVAPYLVSDCPIETFSGMLERYSHYTMNEVVTPEGENILGEEYYEFYVDEEKLDELIVQLFYAEKKFSLPQLSW